MKAKELIEYLEKLKGNPEVILASDEEGNSYSRLHLRFIDEWEREQLVIFFPAECKDFDEILEEVKCIQN